METAALEASIARLNEVFDEYLSSTLAVKLINRHDTASISLKNVEAAERLRIKCFGGRDITQNYVKKLM